MEGVERTRDNIAALRPVLKTARCDARSLCVGSGCEERTSAKNATSVEYQGRSCGGASLEGRSLSLTLAAGCGRLYTFWWRIEETLLNRIAATQ
jgi:hypothetical protein